MVASNLWAEDDSFSYDLQIRHRCEMDGKDFNAGTGYNDFNLLRTRLNLTFKPAKNLEALVQFQDARIFGEESSTMEGSADNLDIHQAYFKVNKLFGLPLTLKLGRMELSYGSQRLLGAVNWHNIGRSFDGVLLTFKSKKLSVDFFRMQVDENLRTGNVGDECFLGAYADLKLSPKYTTQAFILWQKGASSDSLSRFTAGFYAKGTLGKFRHQLEFAYQGGKLLGMDVAALMGAFNVNFTLSKKGMAPDFALGVDYMSGDGDSLDGNFKVFDTLYATNHKFYGFMDYFTSIPGNTFGLGLMDIHAGLSVKPFKKTTAGVKYHMFKADKSYTLPTGATAGDFGNEIDFTCKYAYSKQLTFVVGASVFMPGKIFKTIRGEDTATWFYLMTIFNL